MKNKYYVIIQQNEIEHFPVGKQNERLIYESIKSYSANGKQEVTLSLREIAKRASISYSTVFRYLPNLIKMGMLERIGENTYKVLLPETQSVASSNKNVADSKESVSDIASNYLQINKGTKVKVFSDNKSFSKAMPREIANNVFAALGGNQ